MIEFKNPAALLLLILPLALLGWVWVQKRRVSHFPVFFGIGQGLDRLERRTRWRLRLLFFVLVIGLILECLLIARPSRRATDTLRWSEGLDIAIVLDVSESMEADDLLPNRLDASKRVIGEFIGRRETDRMSLVTFAGEAVTKCPLTVDHAFLREQVQAIRLRELKQGTAIGMGIATAVARLKLSESKHKVLVLLTDGDSNVGSINPMTAAELARSEGIRIYAIGMGKAERVVIPIYSYDSDGRRGPLVAQVPSYLNPELLRDIANLTGGRSYMVRDSGALEQVLREVDSLEKTKIKILDLKRSEDRYRGIALVAFMLLFAAILWDEFRYRRVYASSI